MHISNKKTKLFSYKNDIKKYVKNSEDNNGSFGIPKDKVKDCIYFFIEKEQIKAKNNKYNNNKKQMLNITDYNWNNNKKFKKHNVKIVSLYDKKNNNKIKKENSNKNFNAKMNLFNKKDNYYNKRCSINNNNNSNYFTPKKMNSNNYINEKKNSPYSNSKIIYLKNNPKFAKIRDTIVEKSRKQMGSLNLKKSKRYSFEEIKEHNKKIQESKKLNNNNIHKINRELVRFNSLKNPLIDEKNKVIPPFDENIFINELINICKKHSKDKIIK
jgi:hypothetical protein